MDYHRRCLENALACICGALVAFIFFVISLQIWGVYLKPHLGAGPFGD